MFENHKKNVPKNFGHSLFYIKFTIILKTMPKLTATILLYHVCYNVTSIASLDAIIHLWRKNIFCREIKRFIGKGSGVFNFHIYYIPYYM